MLLRTAACIPVAAGTSAIWTPSRGIFLALREAFSTPTTDAEAPVLELAPAAEAARRRYATALLAAAPSSAPAAAHCSPWQLRSTSDAPLRGQSLLMRLHESMTSSTLGSASAGAATAAAAAVAVGALHPADGALLAHAVVRAGADSPTAAAAMLPSEDPLANAAADVLARQALLELTAAILSRRPVPNPSRLGAARGGSDAESCRSSNDAISLGATSEERARYWTWWATFALTLKALHPCDVIGSYLCDVIPISLGYAAPIGTLPDMSCIQWSKRKAFHSSEFVAAMVLLLDRAEGLPAAAPSDDFATSEGGGRGGIDGLVQAMARWLHATPKTMVIARCFEQVPLGVLGAVAGALAQLHAADAAIRLLRIAFVQRLDGRGLRRFLATELVAWHLAELDTATSLSRWVAACRVPLRDQLKRTVALKDEIVSGGLIAKRQHRSDVDADAANDCAALAAAVVLLVEPAFTVFGKHCDERAAARLAFMVFAHLEYCQHSALPLCYAETRAAVCERIVTSVAVTLFTSVLTAGAGAGAAEIGGGGGDNLPGRGLTTTRDRLDRASSVLYAVARDVPSETLGELTALLMVAASNLPRQILSSAEAKVPHAAAGSRESRRSLASGYLRRLVDGGGTPRLECFSTLARCIIRDAADDGSHVPAMRVLDLVTASQTAMRSRCAARGGHVATEEFRAARDLVVIALRALNTSAAERTRLGDDLLLCIRGYPPDSDLRGRLARDAVVRGSVGVIVSQHRAAISASAAEALTGLLGGQSIAASEILCGGCDATTQFEAVLVYAMELEDVVQRGPMRLGADDIAPLLADVTDVARVALAGAPDRCAAPIFSLVLLLAARAGTQVCEPLLARCVQHVASSTGDLVTQWDGTSAEGFHAIVIVSSAALPRDGGSADVDVLARHVVDAAQAASAMTVLWTFEALCTLLRGTTQWPQIPQQVATRWPGVAQRVALPSASGAAVTGVEEALAVAATLPASTRVVVLVPEASGGAASIRTGAGYRSAGPARVTVGDARAVRLTAAAAKVKDALHHQTRQGARQRLNADSVSITSSVKALLSSKYRPGAS
jgi:hypothetical protein